MDINEIVRLSDMPKGKEEDHARDEQQYRRGYYQGYFQALDEIKRGIELSQIEDHLYTKLSKWRYNDPLTKVIFPPEVKG